MTLLRSSSVLREVESDSNNLIRWKFGDSVPFPNLGKGGELDLNYSAGGTGILGLPGIIGKGVRGISSNGHFAIHMTSNTSVGEANSITLSGWIRNYSGGGGIALIVKNYNLGDTWSSPYPAAALFLDGGGVINFSWSTSAAARTVSSPANSLTDWTFVAGTYEATTGVAIVYVNGLQAATTTITPANVDWGFHGPWGCNTSIGVTCDLRVDNIARPASYLMDQYQRGLGLIP